MTDETRYDRYNTMKQKSTSGTPSSRKNNKRITMKYSYYIKRIKILIGTTAVVVAIATSSIDSIYENVLNKITLVKIADEFQKDIISPETHRTTDNSNYFYDYIDLAKKIEDYGDIDEAVYLLNYNIGEEQTNQVLAHTEYESFDKYKEVKGYKDNKEFNQDMKKRILLANEIKQKKEKLKLMQEEHSDNNINNTYGGRL